MPLEATSDFERHDEIVCEVFSFLRPDFGFQVPTFEKIGGRYRHVAYSRPNLCLEFAVEADAPAQPWWTAVRLLDFQRPDSYAVDSSGRIRRLYRHEIARAIQPHLEFPAPSFSQGTLRGRLEAEADFLRCHARWFLLHSDEVFDSLDHPRPKPPKQLP